MATALVPLDTLGAETTTLLRVCSSWTRAARKSTSA